MKINLSYKLFASIIILLLITVGFFIFKALNIQNDVFLAEEHRFRSALLVIELFQSSEDLTRMARSYVSTGDTIYKRNYFEILDIRNGKRPRPQNYDVTYWHLAGVGRGPIVAAGETIALRDLMQHEGFIKKEFDLLHESQANSDHLVNMEKQAFAALNGLYNDGHGNFTVHRTPDRDYAIHLLFSKEYFDEKARIMTPIKQFMDVLDQRTKDELSNYQAKLQQSIMMALISIMIVMVVVLLKFSHTFRRILYPIERLRSQVAQIASGNYAARCDVLSGDEIGGLCTNFNSMADSLQKDITERKRIEHQVNERVKELRAFYSLSELTEREGVTPEKLFREFINILPQSWQYPEICCARILISGDEFRTNNFKESSWIQSAPIKIYGSVTGRIDIGYLEERPKEDEGPFLKEERLLIDTIAERLGHINERKRAEEALRESSEMVKLLLNSTAEAIYGLDMHGSCTFNNAACLKILGYESHDELLGKNMHEMIHSKHADGTSYDVHQCPIFKAFRSEVEVHVDNEVLWRKDRTSFHAEYWSYPVHKDCKLIGAVVTFLDISERKRAELALQKSTEEREKLIKELQSALDSIKTLQGLIPICANCKKIRDDTGYWNQVEEYIGQHTNAKFTHGICPDCAKKMYGDLYEKVQKKLS